MYRAPAYIPLSSLITHVAERLQLHFMTATLITPRASWTDRETVSVNTKEGGEHVPRPDTGTEV